MALFRIDSDYLRPVEKISFQSQGLMERRDVQRLLRSNFKVIDPNVLIIAEEFSEWEDARRRVDLLGIDKSANLVVVELKRDEDGGHLELQAIRYAAMVQSLTFHRAVEVYSSYLAKGGSADDAQQSLLQFLGWEEPHEDKFGNNVRIVLVSSDFSKEVMTSVLWLNDRGLEIACFRLVPYRLNDFSLIDVVQAVPLPEASDYLVKIRNKGIEQRHASDASLEDTGFWFMNTGDRHPEVGRSWEDCREFSYMLAGGTDHHRALIQALEPGSRFFAYLSNHGFVGYGEVLSNAAPIQDFKPSAGDRKLVELSESARQNVANRGGEGDWCVSVKWLQTFDRSEAVCKHLARQGTLSKFRKRDQVNQLLTIFAPNEMSLDPNIRTAD